MLNNDTQEILAKLISRLVLMSYVRLMKLSELSLTKVGGETLSAREVQEAINGPHDSAIAPLGEPFDSAVKRDLETQELKVGNMETR